ncbi:MAG TPA: ATP-binding protein [Thermoplasmata archaeon]|nr:ATP-binding protein [Thermoplasmata archaeon]
MTSYVVLVRGPLGVGKTTVARAVATALGAQYVSIDRLLDEPGVEEWKDGRITPESFLRVNRRAVGEVAASVERGRPVVFDGNFYYRRQIADLVRRLRVPHRVVTLTAPLPLCIARDARRARSYGAGATTDVYALVAKVRAGRYVDATGSVPETVERVLRLLRRMGPETPTPSRARLRRAGGSPPGAMGRRPPPARARRPRTRSRRP